MLQVFYFLNVYWSNVFISLILIGSCFSCWNHYSSIIDRIIWIVIQCLNLKCYFTVQSNWLFQVVYLENVCLENINWIDLLWHVEHVQYLLVQKTNCPCLLHHIVRMMILFVWWYCSYHHNYYICYFNRNQFWNASQFKAYQIHSFSIHEFFQWFVNRKWTLGSGT